MHSRQSAGSLRLRTMRQPDNCPKRRLSGLELQPRRYPASGSAQAPSRRPSGLAPPRAVASACVAQSPHTRVESARVRDDALGGDHGTHDFAACRGRAAVAREPFALRRPARQGRGQSRAAARSPQWRRPGAARRCDTGRQRRLGAEQGHRDTADTARPDSVRALGQGAMGRAPEDEDGAAHALQAVGRGPPVHHALRCRDRRVSSA